MNITGEIKDNRLRIGNTEVDVYNPGNRTKVPDVLFYENAQVCLLQLLKQIIISGLKNKLF